MILPAVLGGVGADRIPQKMMLLRVSTTQVAGSTLIAVLGALDVNAVIVLVLVSLAMDVSMAFYFPAYSAWLPALVPAGGLQTVNGFEGVGADKPSVKLQAQRRPGQSM